MIHEMKLDSIPFEATKEGLKIIEIRLNDDKRKNLNEGDWLLFENTQTKERLKVLIVNIRKYRNLDELIKSEQFSYTGGIYRDLNHWKTSINSYYSNADQFTYGLLAIEIKLIR